MPMERTRRWAICLCVLAVLPSVLYLYLGSSGRTSPIPGRLAAQPLQESDTPDNGDTGQLGADIPSGRKDVVGMGNQDHADRRDKVEMQKIALKRSHKANFKFPARPTMAYGFGITYPRPEKVKHLPIRTVPHDGIAFNISNVEHIMALVHIQKTAGTTFNRMLTQRLDGGFACRCPLNRSRSGRKPTVAGPTIEAQDWKHCKCYRSGMKKPNQWLFSRTTTGWKCGLHPGFTSMTECLARGKLDAMERTPRNRSYFMLAMLRRPLDRFLSEFAHIQRGATWQAAVVQCNSVGLSRQQMPLCFKGKDWKGATMEEFVSCPHNMGINRQTRMLANLSVVNCFDTSSLPADEYNRRLLQSAKENLAALSWFGITELMSESLQLFEDRFGVKFGTKPLKYAGGGLHSKSDDIWNSLSNKDMDYAISANFLDAQLYEYAKKLLLARHAAMKARQGPAQTATDDELPLFESSS